MMGGMALLLYDGDCGMCAASVKFVLRHERDHAIEFAPLQGETGATCRTEYPHIPEGLKSMVFIEDGRAYLRSKAVLNVARHLKAPWRWGAVLRWLPSPLLDLGYRAIAAVRYRIWGHADACELVTPEQRRRFRA